MAPTIAPYGSWRSSITVEALLIDRSSPASRASTAR
jgi:hypothetical protein